LAAARADTALYAPLSVINLALPLSAETSTLAASANSGILAFCIAYLGYDVAVSLGVPDLNLLLTHLRAAIGFHARM
jgi:hypothetical protein